MREFGLAESTRCLDTSLDWTLVVGHNFDVKLPGAVAEESSCTSTTACAPATTAADPKCRRSAASACCKKGAACARKQAPTRVGCDPRQHIHLDTEGQPPPAASASRRPITSRSGPTLHLRSDRQPNRGSPSTGRTNRRHRRAPQKRTRQKHHRRSRAFPASILWPPMNQTCTTGPSAQL